MDTNINNNIQKILLEYKSLSSARKIKDLSNIKNCMSRLDNPHHKIPPVIHVTGTNGKGSTIEFMKSCLEYVGKKVHVYTSPHLINYTERIVISGKTIDIELLQYYLIKCSSIKSFKENASVFDALTAASFLAFSEHEADITLIEVGIGGKFDPTNIIPIENKIACVFTPISYDHTEMLGDSIEDIIQNKVAIWQEGISFISAMQNKTVSDVLNSYCKDILYSSLYERNIPLIGEHQKINAGTAYTVMKSLFSLDDITIQNGFLNAIWPGRLQQIPICNRIVWIDGAHNPAGAEVLMQYANTNWQYDDIILILGMTTIGKQSLKKDFLAKISLINRIKQIILIKNFHPVVHDNAEFSLQYLQTELKMDSIDIIVIDGIQDCIKYIINITDKIKILFCGSLYFIGSLLQYNYTINDSSNL